MGCKEMTVVDLASRRPLTSLPLDAYVPGVAHAVSADWGPSIAALAAQIGQGSGADLQVTVADEWARYWIFIVPEGVSRLEELQALAATRFEALFGVSMQGWCMLADWRATGAILVCALPEKLVNALQAAGLKGWRVRSIQPSAVRLLGAFARQIPDECWVAVYGRHGVLLARVAEGEVVHVRRHPLSKVVDVERLEDLLEAEILRLGGEAPPVLCVLGIEPPLEPDSKLAGMRLLMLQQNEEAGRTVRSEAGTLALQGVRG
ncbi:hypothetical protein C0V76_16610 [Uliginosibacterium sp. TH139]|nr:hypothetical protein C0V76_16610 [Uliginosibacterium sp. TH139]